MVVHGFYFSPPVCLCIACYSLFQVEVAIHCYHDRCSMSAHMTCLGPKLCESGHIVPISGPCSSCGRELLWGELVRRRKAAEKRKEKEKVIIHIPLERTTFMPCSQVPFCYQ